MPQCWIDECPTTVENEGDPCLPHGRLLARDHEAERKKAEAVADVVTARGLPCMVDGLGQLVVTDDALDTLLQLSEYLLEKTWPKVVVEAIDARGYIDKVDVVNAQDAAFRWIVADDARRREAGQELCPWYHVDFGPDAVPSLKKRYRVQSGQVISDGWADEPRALHSVVA